MREVNIFWKSLSKKSMMSEIVISRTAILEEHGLGLLIGRTRTVVWLVVDLTVKMSHSFYETPTEAPA